MKERWLKVRAGIPPLSSLWLRLRLTLSYSVLSIVSGAVLLVITYSLIKRNAGPGDVSVAKEIAGRSIPVRPLDPAQVGPGIYLPRPEDSGPDRYQLLIVAGIALAIVALVSIALGWLLAGRVLRPIRTMTETLQKISARNLHERLDVTGRRHEIKDLADTIDGLLARLEVALEGHKRFVANAAHELRTPLTVEHALLEEPLIDPNVTVDDFRASFQRLLAISEQRGRLLESLLTLSGSEHGRDQYQPVDLSQVIEQVLRQHRPEVDRLGLQVDPLIVPVQVEGDPALIERLVANLLDNAIHHNHANGWVEIGTRSEPGRVVFFVANSGPVVPPEQVERLVEPFQRLHRVADDGHHGLGLSIVNAIASAHDATLTVQARMTGGLFVEIAFPASTLAAAAPAGSVPQPATL